MRQMINIKKVIFVLPLLAALVYTGLHESSQLSITNHSFGSPLINTTTQNLALIFFAVLLSFGLYQYESIKTGRAQQEEALLRMAGEISWLRGVLDGLPLGVIVFDKSGMVAYINEGFGKISGYDRDFYGQDYKTVEEKIIPVSDRKNPLMESVFKTGLPSGEHKVSLISKGGHIIPVQTNMLPMRNTDGSLTGALCLFSDFTSHLELRNLQQKAHFFLDSTSSCVLAVDKSLRVTLFNTAAENLIGLKKEYVVGRHITEIFNDYEVENYPIIKTIITGEEFHNYDISLFLNGQVRTLLFDTAKITDECGEVTDVIGMFIDISERKRIEEELKRTVFAYSKEKSFMRNVLNNLPVAIITYDCNLQPNYMNRMAEELTGYRSEELAESTKAAEAITAVDLSGDFGRYLATDVLKNEESILSEQRTFNSREGAVIPVSLDVHPLYNALREKNGVMVIARDIREKREHEQLTYLSRCILNSLNSAVICIDADYHIIVFNPLAENLLGIQADAVVGKKIDGVPYPFFKEERILQKTLESGRGVHFQENTILVGGEEIMLQINSDAVRDREDNIIGAVAIFHDVTELRRTQNAVRERERLAIIGQMAAGMAHEIKNPLTAVKGFAQLLKEKCPDNPTLVDYVKIIQEEVDRANTVIIDFLQLSRPKQPLLEWQSVNNLVEEILAVVSPQAFLENIAVEYDSSDNLPHCRLDRDQIKQVLLNMCQNAIEAMPGGGILKAKTGFLSAENEIYIDISDTGCGISPEKIEKIGVPFYTTKAKGTGLGLSISYSIVGAHKGRVNIESKEGEGTTFSVRLPC